LNISQSKKNSNASGAEIAAEQGGPENLITAQHQKKFFKAFGPTSLLPKRVCFHPN